MILIPTHRIIDRASLRARARSRARLPKNFHSPTFAHNTTTARRPTPDRTSRSVAAREGKPRANRADFDRFARASGVTRARPLARDASRADRRADRRAIALSARARRPGAPTRAFSRARAFN
jgi:hypothetical protein